MKVKPGAMVVAACSRRYHTVIGLRVGFVAEAADDERGRCRNTIALSINSRRGDWRRFARVALTAIFHLLTMALC